MNFSEKTLVALKKAGWHEGYRFDASNYIRILEDCHFEVSDAVRIFLSQYGNLNIECDHQNVVGGIDRLSTIIWPELAPWIFPNTVEFRKLTGISCCFVGRCRDEDTPIYMDGNGIIYASDDHGYYLVGETIEQSLNNLVEGREFLIVFEDEEVPYVPSGMPSSPFQKLRSNL